MKLDDFLEARIPIDEISLELCKEIFNEDEFKSINEKISKISLKFSTVAIKDALGVTKKEILLWLMGVCAQRSISMKELR